ncbi:MAG TPA: tetratricopeptide repeat protein, partial [Thermoanaerobaculia bacterium]|nr:tetratricopeptide repeat protein [Thermoanaerobaculia bacterium]
RGDLFARMGRVDDAVAAYRREIANFPNDTQAYANLAIIYFIEGRRADTNRLLDEMVRANPHPGARELAARTRESLKD